MSTLFKGVSKQDLQFEKTKPALIAPEIVSQGMSPVATFSITLSLLLAVASLAFASYLYYESQAEKAGWSSVEASQVQFGERVQSLETDANQARVDLASTKQQLKTITSENGTLKSEINNYHVVIANLQKELKDLKEKAFQPEEISLLSIPAPSSGESTKVEIQTPASESQTKSDISPEPTIAKNVPQVLTINRKFKFVVINTGLKDKMKIGESLTVERNGKKIGTVAVEKLYDNFSAATIVEEAKNASIQEGDTVRRSS
ncbi:MAG: hypothetical protein HYZ84_03095 [Candidatus Omnitrophica bacterium]|nr:hypothetical protein [Candidatus Omnitrophota bacterium]